MSLSVRKLLFCLPLLVTIFFSASIPLAARAQRKEAFFTLQTGAFRDFGYAEETMRELKCPGFPVFHIRETRGKEDWYKVCLGRFDSREKALKAAVKLKKEGRIRDCFIKYLAPGIAEKAPPDQKESGPASGPKNGTAGEQGALPTVKKIGFRLEKGHEIVQIHGSGPVSPFIILALQGEAPSITIDINEILAVEEDLSNLAVRGRWLRNIAADYVPEKRCLRLNLYLRPNIDYRVSQTYDPDRHIYSVGVAVKPGSSGAHEEKHVPDA